MKLPYMAVLPVHEEVPVPPLVLLEPREERQTGGKYCLQAKVEEDDATPERSERLLDLPIEVTIRHLLGSSKGVRDCEK